MFSPNTFLFQVICFNFYVVITVHSYRSAVTSTGVRVRRQFTDNGCILPQHPTFGSWSVYRSANQLNPGMLAPSGTVLQVTCRDTYKLDGDAALVCINARWTTEVGQCLKTCPSIYSTSVMTVTCTYNNKRTENCTNAVDGTVAKFRCAPYYEDGGLDRHPAHVCFNGKWSHSIPECVPVCGQKSIKNDPTLIVNGSTVTKGDYPWQVAIYNTTDKELLCGGSLLNQRVILTAAHCITNERGKLLPTETYVVAVGKYYRTYNDPRDFKESQFSNIYKMFIPRQYKGEIQNYFGDIAILVTHKTFVLSARVQPVCVDWGFKYDNALFDPTRKIFGHVSGWGYTIEYKQPSEVLKELEVPLINYEQCIQELPEDYEKFMTDDKLCAGYLNSGTSVCRGDSGGGLVFKFGKRYYVTAVVSLSPQAPTANGGCDSQRYALYTQISHYIEEFIIDKEARYRSSGSIECDQDPNCEGVTTDKPVTLITTPSSQSRPTLPNGNCLLPEHPTSGQWSVFGGGSVHTPGMSVTSESILRIRCSQGYQLDGKELVLCNNGSWSSPIGQCLKTCPSLVSTKTITIVCTFKNNETSKCINPPHGTIAKHVCAPFYEDLALVKNPVRVCRNGTWDSKKPECVPVCGQKAVSAQTLIINGKKAEKASYPWHVGIYRTENRRLVCNGALISQRLILTSAHCITDRNGVLLPKRRFTVAVGKLYRQFNSTRDVEAQYSTVEDMFIPLEYTGVKNNFLADIGLIVVQNSFTLSRSVQPVCVDWVLAYDDVSLHNVKNITGWVSGWGYTVAGANPADQLRELKVPLIPRNKCNQDLPENFQHLFTHDKLCAGYLNSSTSLCDGDGGGALVVKHEGRYYVTGIVSASPVSSAEICDSQQYALFTKVAQYNSFISEKEAQFRPFGNADCNNDEDPSICQKPTTETPSKTEGHRTSCILPEHPKSGSWLIYFGFSSSKFSPGMSVEEGTVLQVKCLDKYKLDGNSVILCENGKWNSEVGTCLKTCSSSYSTSTTKVTCFLKGKELENCIEPVEGTLAKYECATYYEDPQLTKNPINICLNGFWDQRQPNCVPVCGQKSVTAQTLIVNGNNVNKGDYPWHVAVYYGKNRRFMCGASLISQRLIVTSAQCVTDQKGNVHPKNDFIVAAGKYYRLYNHSGESNDAQFSTVQEIFVPEFYTATSGNYFGDIAILVTSIPFVLSQKVQPVCVDWSLIYENDMSNPSTNLTGYVTGWGFTSSDGASDLAKELKELKVPIINFNECFKKLPPDFTQFLTSDKLCAGYLNNGIAVCHGDSGGGLVVKFNSRYYITGIVSVSPRTNVGGCDIQQYALYTKISPYIDKFISRKQQQFRT